MKAFRFFLPFHSHGKNHIFCKTVTKDLNIYTTHNIQLLKIILTGIEEPVYTEKHSKHKVKNFKKIKVFP